MTAQDRRVWGLIVVLAAALIGILITGQALLDIRFDYTLQIVALGGALLGALSGLLGTFAVLRQQAMMGDALSHAALPGVAVAFLLVGRDLGALLTGAAVSGWLGVLFVRAVTRSTRIKQDAAMGIVLTVWFAAGIALLTYIQGRSDASQAGLDHFIFGQAAGMRADDVRLMLAAGAVMLLIVAVLWKEIKLVTFDMAFAHSVGLRTRAIDLILSSLIVVVIVLGLRLVGVILMVSLLIAPAVAARQWTHRLSQMVVLSGLFGAFSGAVGAIVSAVDVDIPTGPMIIVVASILAFISILFAPERGVLWTVLKNRRDRRQYRVSAIGSQGGL
jgi:manganese/zinc/iron transport system permease protein